MKNIHADHRQRVREEFLNNGLEHFPDHKVLEMLLFYAISRGDTNQIGHNLMNRFGSVSAVFDASYEMLLEVDGIGPQSATLIKLTAGIIRRYMDDFTTNVNTLPDTASAKEYFRHKFLCQQTESVLMVCIGHNGKIIFSQTIANGSPENVSISAALVVKTALRANSARVLLAHNHPNGISVPSSRDLYTTSMLYQELRRVDVELVDHIIVAPDGVYSMKEGGMFPAGQGINK